MNSGERRQRCNPVQRPPKGNPYEGLRILGPGQQNKELCHDPTRRHEIPPACPAYIEQGQGVIEIVAEIQRAVVSATGYEFAGAIEMRAFVNREHAAVFGQRVVLNSVSAELDELRAAVRKMERMRERMRRIDKELGDASTFAEYVRRGLRAAGVGVVHVARDAAGRPRNASNYVTVRADDGASVLEAAGRLESIALMLFGLRAEAA